MNILVIGGTRLLGLAIVKQLVLAGYKVTVLSRHPEKCPFGTECIGTERAEGLARLVGRKFDVTIDFIAYDESAPTQVCNHLHPGVYILISSTWMVRLFPSIGADQVITTVDVDCAKRLPNITYSYLIGKMRAENVVLEMRKKNGTATILRLPIFWGRNEHTGRLDFYRQRIADEAPIICIEGGNNYAQIVWIEDVARVVIDWLHVASNRPIWEALPNRGTKVRDIIKLIAQRANKQPKLVSVSLKQLRTDLPDYLNEEPLWREKSINITESNLFRVMKINPTPMDEWLCDLANEDVNIIELSDLRKKEIIFLDNIFKL